MGGEPGIGGCQDFREGKSRLVLSEAVSQAGRQLVGSEQFICLGIESIMTLLSI